MTQTAKLFNNGRSQAVRLPAAYRFEGAEVFIRRDVETGDVILSRRPGDWDGFFAAVDQAQVQAQVPSGLLSTEDRAQATDDRDPFAGWSE